MEICSVKTVLNNFSEGQECAQQVCMYFADQLGMDTETVYKVSAAVGTGMGCGGTCGCVAGALMVLGMRYGAGQQDSPLAVQEAKELLQEKRAQFEDLFRQEFGALTCRELLQHDLTKPEDVVRVTRSGLFESVCAPQVCRTIEILEELL